ncbi:MAG TPA: HD domain-containing phosphohydrolase [Chthonomonadaceae bacterium]|nr:HD domain-containing phosphohydrolase [Chthonomonadaceae bacterium]
MKRSVRALLIVDSQEDILLLVRLLRKLDIEVSFESAATPDALGAALRDYSWDLILADRSPKRFAKVSPLSLIRSHAPTVPVIVVSDTPGEDHAAEALRAGANDYALKTNLGRLAKAVERELREVEERREAARTQLAHREASERSRTIVAIAPDGIITFDDRGIIQSFNPAAVRIFGYEEVEVVGEHLNTVLPGHASGNRRGASVEEVFSRYGADGYGVPNEWTGLRKDKTTVSVEITISRYEIAGREHFTCWARDLTDTKRTQAQMRSQFQRLNAARAIDVAITGSFDLRVTLNIVLDQVTSLLGVDAADVLLVDAGSTLTCAASRGFNANVRMSRCAPIGEGLAGQAAVERRIVEVSDLRNSADGQVREELTPEGLVAYSAVPLIAKGRLPGVLEAFHRSELEKDADWYSFLDSLANQTSIAIDNTLMFEELQRRNADLTIAYDRTIEGWVRALDLRDNETPGHSRRVTEMMVCFARALGFPEDAIVNARRGALLHDIGKLGVPDAILIKPGALTDAERAIMQMHPEYAHEWLSPVDFLRNALDIPYGHHERWDGGGYPRQLAGAAIPIAARMFALIDVWDALTTDRPYRKAWSPQQVIEYVRSNSGTHFDPDLVGPFLDMVSKPAELRPAAGAQTSRRAAYYDPSTFTPGQAQDKIAEELRSAAA